MYVSICLYVREVGESMVHWWENTRGTESLDLTYEFWAEEVLIKHQKRKLDLFIY